MKKLILSTAFILASVAIAASSASAQNVSLQQNDLIMGFRVTDSQGTGGTTNLELDLGQVTNFEGLAAGTVLNLNSSSVANPGLNVQDLINTYGSNWASRSDLVFGFFAANTDLNTGANTVAVSSPNNIGKPTDSFDLSGPAGQMISGYSNVARTANSSNTGTVSSTGASGNYSATVTATGDYNGSFSFNTENSVSSGSPAKSDLYSTTDANSDSNVGVDNGYFSLASDGTLKFTVPAAVPEPSAYALGICAVLLFLVLRRRQMVA